MLKQILEKIETKKDVKESKINEEIINYQDQFVVELLPEQKSAMLMSMFGFFTKYPVVRSEKELGADLANKIAKFDKEKLEKLVEKVEITEANGIMILVIHAHFKDGKNELKLKFSVSNGDMKVVED